MARDPTVFIVDDDEAIRDSLSALLETEGFKVATFGTGRAFLDAIDASRRGCVLLDVRMPDINGLELQQRLAAKHIDLPVIIMTGHAEVPMAVKAMKAGAVDFIEKPFDDGVILAAIRRALARPAKTGADSAEAADAASRIAGLTPRERQVLDHLVLGSANKVIAFELGISPRTVEIHRARVMDKMQAKSLSELVRMALAAGIRPPSA
ncbi:MAG: response regulator transcription factor [Proteobacteria bacterium]|nr:response regulator transcription factor [Pseudomonadota bacterium]